MSEAEVREVMARAARAIVAADPAFAEIVTASPLCDLTRASHRTEGHPEWHFADLVKSVVAQQLSTAVADVLFGRLTQAADGRLTARRVLALDEAQLRALGLSRAKVRTIHGLAAALADGSLDLESAIADEDDHRLIAELTSLWGIGRWTVEMFLMFSLHRLDVWPVGDLAMRRGWQILHGESQPPTARELDPLGVTFAPYRSVAAWYCWRVVDGDNPSW